MNTRVPSKAHPDRRTFIGGSDARIIMGDDHDKLVRLWREKRGEIAPQDLSQELIVQLDTTTEDLNRSWYERNSGHTVEQVQRKIRHPVHKWMGATLDGRVEQTGAVFEAKFMLPWNFSEEAAADKHMAQLQHNMWVIAARSAVLSIITGDGNRVEITVHADPLYQHLLLTAEKKFWRCVQTGERPTLFNIETPRPRLETIKIVGVTVSLSGCSLNRARPNTHHSPADKTRNRKHTMSDKIKSQKDQHARSQEAPRRPKASLRPALLSSEADKSRLKKAPPPNSIRHYRRLRAKEPDDELREQAQNFGKTNPI